VNQRPKMTWLFYHVREALVFEPTAEAVGVIPMVGEDRVADALNLAPVLGLTWGGEDKKLRDLVEATVPKVKGMRELKNLDCAISPVKDKRRRGWSGSKNAFSFPPEVHKGFPWDVFWCVLVPSGVFWFFTCFGLYWVWFLGSFVYFLCT
jgi:hypothetical protein